jgi:uncharacterized membrane protein
MGTMVLAAGLAGDNMQGRFGDGDAHHPVMRAIVFVVFLAVVAGLIWSLVALSRAKKRAAAAAATSSATATNTAAAAAPAGYQSSTSAAPSALQILDERLARGEIEPSDYEARKRLLV